MNPASDDLIEEPSRPLMRWRFVWTALCCAALVGAGLLAYSDSFHGPFIFDDGGFIHLSASRRS